MTDDIAICDACRSGVCDDCAGWVWCDAAQFAASWSLTAPCDCRESGHSLTKEGAA